jgi:hypothetical protein
MHPRLRVFSEARRGSVFFNFPSLNPLLGRPIGGGGIHHTSRRAPASRQITTIFTWNTITLLFLFF